MPPSVFTVFYACKSVVNTVLSSLKCYSCFLNFDLANQQLIAAVKPKTQQSKQKIKNHETF